MTGQPGSRAGSTFRTNVARPASVSCSAADASAMLSSRSRPLGTVTSPDAVPTTMSAPWSDRSLAPTVSPARRRRTGTHHHRRRLRCRCPGRRPGPAGDRDAGVEAAVDARVVADDVKVRPRVAVARHEPLAGQVHSEGVPEVVCDVLHRGPQPRKRQYSAGGSCTPRESRHLAQTCSSRKSTTWV